ncbi:MAG: FAD-dependent oxidoreductase [Myxococcota bacterium]
MSAPAASCDVVVIGGGSAGVAAALAASRAGARTVLVEREPVLGGNAAHALVHTICGLYLPAESGEAVLAHAGVPREIALALGGAPERAGRVWYLGSPPDSLSALYSEKCRSEASLELRLGASLEAAELARGAGGESVLAFRHGDGSRELRARVVIDASGDAAVAFLGGAAWEIAPAALLQCASYIFRLDGVDAAALAGFARVRLTTAVAGATRSGALPLGAESVVLRACGEPGQVFVTLNVARPAGEDWRPLDRDCVASLEASAREAACAIAAFLRETRPEFASSRLAEHPRRIGIRETRRALGPVVLAADDVLAGIRRDDEVALSTWPIELWHDHRRPTFEYPRGACSVPLGALVSRTHPRLGMAGRCVSATHEALGALRVIGTSLATGEAIGRAAAFAADEGVALGAIAPARVREHTRAR